MNMNMILRALHSVQLDTERGWAAGSGSVTPTGEVEAAAKGTLYITKIAFIRQIFKY